MPDNAVSVSTGVATLPEATQQAIKDVFKSLPRFDGTKGFEYYEYDWNSRNFKNLDNVSHPEELKIAFPKASMIGTISSIRSERFMGTYHVDASFLDLEIFPHINLFNTSNLRLLFYYNNFLNSTASLTLSYGTSGGSSYEVVPFVVYIGNYSGIHYFVAINTGADSTTFWILSFNPSNGTLAEVRRSSSLSGKRAVHSRIYKYFDTSNNTFEFSFIARNRTSGSFELVRAVINLSNFNVASFTATTLVAPQYFINNVTNYLPSARTLSPIQNYSAKNFVYAFDDPVKLVNSQTVNDVLLLSFWDPIYNPTEVKIVLVPFSLDTNNGTISYNTPIEKTYNPFSITPKLYKHTINGEDRIYIQQYNSNYDYFVDNVVSRIDNFLLILQNFNESDYSFDVIGHKVFTEDSSVDIFANDHSIITLDSCKGSKCNTIYSLYSGVGTFFGYYPVTKKHDRFYFVYVPQNYNENSSSSFHMIATVATLVYDLQNPLPIDYQPPTSSTDISRLSKNPWFVEFAHPGIEKFELSSVDLTYGPIYKNSRKIYLWSNIYVNYPSNGYFSVNIESLFRGDGFFYPKNFLFARDILADFSSSFTSTLHSPFSTGSFLYFLNTKNTSYINAAVSYVLKYAYSPDLSSLYFGAIQGGSAFPIAIMSILSEGPRVYKWFNIYGNIAFFNTRRAFAPSRGFFSGSSLNTVNVYNNNNLKYKKVANFYPLFGIDSPKPFSGQDAVITHSSYKEGKDVKINTLKFRTFSPTSKIALGFYFYPIRSRNFEVREFDSTGNFYFNILNPENVLFVPDSGENLKVGDTISITSNNVTYFYEVVDTDTFSNVYIYPYSSPSTSTVNVYLVLRK
jgi:hypothetical protein